MEVNRRSVVAALGLGTTPVYAERMLDPGEHVGPQVPNDSWSNKAFANALRELANGVESGEFRVMGMNLHASMQPNDIVKHALTVDFWNAGIAVS